MNKIRELREAAGISQAELHRALNWRQSRLANYESCARTPSLNDAREIVAALNSLGVSCELGDAFPAPDQHKAARPVGALQRAEHLAENRQDFHGAPRQQGGR